MRKIFLFINTVCLLSLVACSTTENESTDKKDASEVKDSTDTNEETVEQSAKQKLLTSMIGTHKLSSIDGMVGMNSMFNFAGKDDIWKGEGSSNMDGEREGYDIEIGEEQLAKLKSMSIVVSEDLTVTLESNGKTLCKIPYDENLKEFKLKNSKEYLEYDVIPKELSEEKSVFNSWHYLLVRDDYSKDLMNEMDAAAAFESEFICIKVSENLKEFQVDMRAGACCDQATYIFKK
jgi:hypothetical protein